MSKRSRLRFSTPHASSSAFTLIELLVVIALILVLIGAIVVAGNTLINDAKVKNTRSVLLILRDAVEQFRQEESARRTVTRLRDSNIPPRMTYEKRYGLYPPDELEGFTPVGVPGGGTTMQFFTASRQNWTLMPKPAAGGYARMTFARGTGIDAALENRDLAAMLLSLELFCEPAAAMLAQIPDRNRSPGPETAAGIPTRFVDRSITSNQRWDEDDLQMRLLIDDWGQPFGYMAQRDWVDNPTPQNPQAPVSSNHKDWNQTSTQLIRLNGGQPLLFSYGPDGKYQTSPEAMGIDGRASASLPSDWVDTSGRFTIEHALNRDNVYVDPALNEKFVRGTP